MLDGVDKVYCQLENNPNLYRESQDPFMKAFHYVTSTTEKKKKLKKKLSEYLKRNKVVARPLAVTRLGKRIEVEERNDFISQIASCSQAFLRKISTKEKFRNLIQKPLDAIKALVVSFDPNDNTFSLSMQEMDLYKSNNLTQSLTEVFTTIGETAYKTETPICFFIDEVNT